ncbi:MAG TPA: cellulase family glycosylhydrolase [Planktothrix sp.]|jgi:hypothetical protein
MRLNMLRRKRICIPASIVLVLLAATAIYLLLPPPPLPSLYNHHGLHGGFVSNGSFIVGANYPCNNYGQDFGTNGWGHLGLSEPAQRARVDKDFAWFEQHNIHVIRWFVFGDMRAGILYNPDGTVAKLDDYFFKDMDLAVQEAQQHKLMIIMVMFDFTMVRPAKKFGDVQTMGRKYLITDRKGRQSLIDNALTPMVDRYAHNGAVVAWEVMNEPEWSMQMPGGTPGKDGVPVAAMQQFVTEIAALVHTHSEQAVTVGGARRNWLTLWKNSGLDFYQYHFYPWMVKGWFRTPYNYPETLLKLDKPCIIGEVPTNDANAYTRYLDQGLANGYTGVFGWSLRATDPYAKLDQRGSQIDGWELKHRGNLQQP